MAGKRCSICLLVILLFTCGCNQKPGTSADRDVVVSINNYKILRGEFENEFNASAYGKINTPESRLNFLNTLIDRKLVLQYAQKEGLDKEKVFLGTVEKFWEQSLLKVALDKRTREVESKIVVSDWVTKRAQETQLMNDWMDELRLRAHITIKDSVLKNVADKDRSR